MHQRRKLAEEYDDNDNLMMMIKIKSLDVQDFFHILPVPHYEL